MQKPDSKLLAIVVHDVAPSTWPLCSRLAELVKDFGGDIPLTLLVVPHFHRGPAMHENPDWRRWIDARLAQGDELALHGLYHLDEGRPPRTPASWFARRVMTAGEAEFAALGSDEARARIECGLQLFRQCGWRAAGFVPPAWQIGAEARSVLREFPFSYTSTLRSLIELPQERRWNIPCLGFSARSALRRWLSIRWNEQRLEQLSDAPLIRVALHPIDAAYENTLSAWRHLLGVLLTQRRAVTKAELCAQLAA